MNIRSKKGNSTCVAKTGIKRTIHRERSCWWEWAGDQELHRDYRSTELPPRGFHALLFGTELSPGGAGWAHTALPYSHHRGGERREDRIPPSQPWGVSLHTGDVGDIPWNVTLGFNSQALRDAAGSQLHEPHKSCPSAQGHC